MIFPKADLHIHPFLKPYGHSFYTNNNQNDSTSAASPWFNDPDTTKDDGIENVFGFAPYRQSDLTSCKNGNLKLVINSFYSIEQGFLEVKDTSVMHAIDKIAGKALADAITEFGKEWISLIRSADYNYFNDLIGQMNFAEKNSNKIPINGISKYRVLKDASNIDNEICSGDLLLINSIEGAQCLCNGNNPADEKQWDNIEERIIQVKNHTCRPFFITLAHHFYNGLCSHSESLFDLKKFIRGQETGMSSLKKLPFSYNYEITPIGYKIIDNLLSVQNGPRILIDVKHMSKAARNEFYQYRKSKYSEIPIVYSHGACCEFYNYEINLYNDDIVEIANSGGLIGIEWISVCLDIMMS